jgi:ribosomal protein S18 acetylase RimI-like enzyme
MAHVTIRPFAPKDTADVIACWRACNLIAPWNDPESDIALKLAFQPELFFVAVHEEIVVGTVMVGYEGHRGWINYLGVLPEWRKHDVGRQLMEKAEAVLRAMGCPKINLMVRKSNLGVLGFYERLGFKPDEVVCLGKRLTP